MLLPAKGMAVLQSAGITGLITAVRGLLTFQGTLVFSLEKSVSYFHVNMAPGQRLIQGALALGIEGGFDSALVEGTKPVLMIEMFVPGVKG